MLVVPNTRIFVVEDNCPFLDLLCSLLAQHTNVTVVGKAQNGIEAVQLARELQPDVVLLDVGLPLQNGIEAGYGIRRVSPASKIVFLSSEYSPDVVHEAFTLGAHGYMHKLHVARELAPAILAVLNGQRFLSKGLRDCRFATVA